MDWKVYYQQDFKLQEDLVEKMVSRYWDKEDRALIDIINRGGFLSFPHTHISSSVIPLVRCLNAVYRSEREKCLAIGVFHSNPKGSIDLEFSLDNLFRSYKFIKGLDPSVDVNFQKIFLPDKNGRPKTAEDAMKYRKKYGGIIKDHIDEDTSILITGDLIHYGKVYGNEYAFPEIDGLYEEIIDDDLQRMINKKDIESYIEISEKHLNDQTSILLPLVHSYKQEMDFKIFSSELTDYSKILETDEPTLVASVLYGAFPI